MIQNGKHGDPMSEKFEWGEHSIEGDAVELAGYDTYRTIEQAEKHCSNIARSHYENFVVSNWFTPPEVKQHIENIYAFCRYGDDLGDDAPFPPEQRLQLLNEWESDLKRAAENDWNGEPRHPILTAVQRTASYHSIPVEPFIRLIHAFKMDQTKTRYNNWEELREYCIHSADPVGHLFLYVYGHDDEEMRVLADNTCTALQLANHWQDVSRDLEQDRIYVPLDEMEQFGYTLEMYQNREVNEAWRTLIKHQVDRAQKMFDDGRKLWEKVDPRLAVDLRMFTTGGEAVLRSIRKQNYNTFTKRPRVSKLKQVRLFISTWLAWKRAIRRHKRSKKILT